MTMVEVVGLYNSNNLRQIMHIVPLNYVNVENVLYNQMSIF